MENKNVGNKFKEMRKETMNMSREMVCLLSGKKDEYIDISPERLERIENGKFEMTPEEALTLSKIYDDPSLCKYYCHEKCRIGQEYVPKIEVKDLEKIILSMVASLNCVKNEQERLIEITEDGVIKNDELRDFIKIQQELEKISLTVDTLQLWTEHKLSEGKIDRQEYQRLKEKL